MKTTKAGTVFEGEPGSPQTLCCFPSLCRLGNGDLLATFQCGPEKNHADGTVCLCRSTDGGASWSTPVTPFRDWARGRGLTAHVVYLAEIEPGLLVADLMLCDHLGDPGLPFFNPATGGALPIVIGVSISADNGMHWSEPCFIKTGRFDDVPAPIMSPVRRTSDGNWLLPFETSKSYHDADDWDHYAACAVSCDRGDTWGACVAVANDPEKRRLYWDQRLVALDGNRCLAFFWTFDTQLGRDTTVHRSVSSDGGRSWPAVPEDTGLVGQSTWPVPLDDDRIVALTVDRYGEGVIKACLSNDLGANWTESLVLHRHALSGCRAATLNDNLSEQALWSFGLPSGIRTGAGELLAVWYSGGSGHTAIHWARVLV